jgi:hypothetical protein
MADVFRKRTVRWFDQDGKRCPPETPGATRRVEDSRKWYGTVDGRHVPLCRDKQGAERLLCKLQTDATMRQNGLVDPFEASKKQPLSAHLEDFHAYLLAKGNTPKHARQTSNRAQAILDGCRFTFLPDVSPSAVMEWLAAEREAGRLTIQTSNYYLRDLKAFCRWMVRDRRAGENPLQHLSGLNAAVEEHRKRRHLEPDDFAAFIEAAQTGRPVRRLSGPDRATL